MSFQISYESSNVLFLRAIVERKNSKVGKDKENSKKKPQPDKFIQSCEFGSNRIKGKVEAEEKEGEKADEVP